MNRAFTQSLRALALTIALAAAAFGATIKGTVTNGTTNKPSAGDDVVVLRLAGGMEEAGRTKTDAKGRFTLTVPDSAGPQLLRVTHDKVNYHEPLAPGRTTADVQVYDAATKGIELSVTAYQFLVRAGDGAIQIQEEYEVSNNSVPPRTYNPDQTFKIQLPANAQIDEAVVARPNSNPLNSAPVPAGKPGLYYFAYPIRPGETAFQVTYHLPYSGKLTITPQPQYRFREFGVAVPEAMTFKSDSLLFKNTKQASGVTGALALDVKPGDNLSYSVAGTGELPRQNPAGEAPAGAGGNASAKGPGGGIGNPEGTPDPLRQFRWYILGGLAIVLAAAGVYIYRRPSSPAATQAATTGADITRPPGTVPAPSPVSRSNVLMEAVKEELFRLEMELHQGAITPEEYERTRSALNLLIARELKRSSERSVGA